MMFDLIDVKMNAGDEDRRRVHQKYGICWIVQNLYPIKNPTTITLLLPMMFDWIYEKMNGSDEVWR